MKNIIGKNKQPLMNKSIFDDGKSSLFEKCITPVNHTTIICQEMFFKKSKKKKGQNKLITFMLTDEFLLLPKVLFRNNV